MIIVSQDKMEIYNFNEIFRLYVDDWSNEEFATEPNCFCVKAEKSSDNMICAFLGEYETEERAKEVLAEIIRMYKVSKGMSFTIGDEKKLSGKYENEVYYMPEE